MFQANLTGSATMFVADLLDNARELENEVTARFMA
jgi:hypothetical protein